MKITDYKVQEGNQGVWLTFDEAIKLNGHLASKEWFVSWEKLSEIIKKYLEK